MAPGQARPRKCVSRHSMHSLRNLSSSRCVSMRSISQELVAHHRSRVRVKIRIPRAPGPQNTGTDADTGNEHGQARVNHRILHELREHQAGQD
eukprot:scaffold516_cov270-Pinguiococcus_pyrenoidosus.AAC.12